ncbi:MAG: 4'-phosphopantetheinyl transferase superfamily protein [candidate division KSB1 bacterium]|nr:4'-phosphopantetheinyl transferase superfamily protein [candidate division KSB1 bacterium]MDZ7302676.1 4'-phosphopantetheinyl transferase superfamily protein [candidate division KSB1 bacterium]MDZ7311793.1 4'-phosphopantetheinyl transferase superfamily protein [candidate division KSB1 bacterium]
MSIKPSVYWLIQYRSEVPEHDNWLTSGEQALLAGKRFPKRRAEWRLGRWTAKCALAAYFENEARNNSPGSPKVPAPLRPSLASIRMRGEEGTTTKEIEIRAAADGAPEAFMNDEPIPVALSISHRDEIGFCVVSPGGFAVGCDVEAIEPRSDAFVTDFFTVEEQALLRQTPVEERPWIATLIWSAKESALKALRQGLRLDTRSVMVDLRVRPADSQSQDWNPLTVHYLETARSFHGCWRRCGGYLQTMIADPSPE